MFLKLLSNLKSLSITKLMKFICIFCLNLTKHLKLFDYIVSMVLFVKQSNAF